MAEEKPTVSEADMVTDTEPSTAPIRTTEKPRNMRTDTATDTEPTKTTEKNHCGKPLRQPQRISSKTTYTCSHCGTIVVPVEVETPTGTKERREEAKGPLPPPEPV